MKKFEHRFIVGVTDTEALTRLKQIQGEGWELVAVRDNAEQVVYYIKREKK